MFIHNSQVLKTDKVTTRNVVIGSTFDLSLYTQRYTPPKIHQNLTRARSTRESYESLAYLYRIPKQTLSYIIPETCDAIYKVLKDTYMKVKLDSIKDVHRPSREIVEDIILKYADPELPAATRQKMDNLIRNTNRTRQRLRPTDPTTLDFEPFHSYLQSTYLQPSRNFKKKLRSHNFKKLTSYVHGTWMTSTVWMVEHWTVFMTATRTNNNVEGRHNRLNTKVTKHNFRSTVLKEAKLLLVQCKMVSEEKLQRHQRKHTRQLQYQLFQLWDQNVAAEITDSQLLGSKYLCCRQHGEIQYWRRELKGQINLGLENCFEAWPRLNFLSRSIFLYAPHLIVSLRLIPGVGKKKASEIIKYRIKYGSVPPNILEYILGSLSQEVLNVVDFSLPESKLSLPKQHVSERIQTEIEAANKLIKELLDDTKDQKD
ncbi:hypothetical protein KUTeg_023893 [Tegillarca granosa]|uniref:Uncharacterized protein n=1 Tax=Tegillarca granosa TaxID=220873 RepID=A0ABQ9E061_TEGGR|nr:hypothetical protein KUTeg_023893 [Tegillarca granosa]